MSRPRPALPPATPPLLFSDEMAQVQQSARRALLTTARRPASSPLKILVFQEPPVLDGPEEER